MGGGKDVGGGSDTGGAIVEASCGFIRGFRAGIGNWSGLVGIGACNWAGGVIKEVACALFSLFNELGGKTSVFICGEIVFNGFAAVGGGAVFWSKNDAGLLLKLRVFVKVWDGECLNIFEEISLTSVEGVRLCMGWKWFELGGKTMSGWMLPMLVFKLNASFINVLVVLSGLALNFQI